MSAPPPYPSADPSAAYYPPQPAYQHQQQQQPPYNREQHYRSIIQKYEISEEFGKRMQLLQGFKVVFIFDDSSSMKSSLSDSPLNNPNSLLNASRWDELKYFADISIEIASIFDTNGCDVHFLNKGPFTGITHAQQLAHLFQQGPHGYTPLESTFNAVMGQNQHELLEKKLLVIIVTDGQPTDTRGNVDIQGFRRCLERRTPIDKIFVTIVACTDDDSCIDYLDKWDREIRHLDVCDDFRSERKQIQKINGRSYPFSYGDYVVKCLIGCIDPTIDMQDERRKKNKCPVS